MPELKHCPNCGSKARENTKHNYVQCLNTVDCGFGIMGDETTGARELWNAAEEVGYH